MVVIGVVGFAVASACCGFTPKGSIAETWLIAFRVVQGAMAALMFPAAVVIVVASFPLRERGRAMAIFFGIFGALTAVGPLAGGYLTQWTWRSISWINIPVAIIALLLIRISHPDNEVHPAKLDYRGTANWTRPNSRAFMLITAGRCWVQPNPRHSRLTLRSNYVTNVVVTTGPNLA